MKPALIVLASLLIAACRSEAPEPVVPELSASVPADVSEGASDSASAVATPAEVQAPSFDCAAASRDTEKQVCSDPELSALDRQLDAEFRKAMAAEGADQKTLAATQRGWIKGRDDCWKSTDMPRCVLESYKTQIVQLKLDSGQVMVPSPVSYLCDDSAYPLTAVFYNDIEPKAAVITRGDDQAIAFPLASSSGARYGREGLDFWEHDGEVTVDFWGTKLVCKPLGGRPGGV